MKMENNFEISDTDLQQILNLQNRIFNISLRYICDFAVAEDAVQDIMLKIMKNFNTLREKEKFIPWALTITANHLKNLKKELNKFHFMNFDIMEKDCSINMPDNTPSEFEEFEKEQLLAELKISCSQAMLMCLSDQERLIYILSSMFGFNSKTGGEILEISSDNFRQKLSRIKRKMKSFLEKNCGLVNSSSVCKCNKRISYAVESKRIFRNSFQFTSSKYLPPEFEIKQFVKQMDEIEDFMDVFNHNPEYYLPSEVQDKIKNILLP